MGIIPWFSEGQKILNSEKKCRSLEKIFVMVYDYNVLTEKHKIIKKRRKNYRKLKKGIDVLEFSERDEQGGLKGREVLEFFPEHDDGTSRGVDVLLFSKDDSREPSVAAKAPQHIVENDDVQRQICSEEQGILELVRQDMGDMVSWIPASTYPATNIGVKVQCKKIFRSRTGKELLERGEIECKIFVDGKTVDLTVKNRQIRMFARIVTDSIPEAIIDHEAKKADKVIEEQFRRDIARSRTVQIFCQAGWNRIDGRWCYVYDGIELGRERYVETGLTLPRWNCRGEDIIQIFLRACDLCWDMPVVSTMFSFSLLGVLYRLFEEAGYRPRFVLFINGKTGSMKTTIAKILYTQLCRDEFRDEPRRFDTDTEVSLERALVFEGHDTVTPIDDFSPAKTETKKSDLVNKLETIIRMVGDGSSRSRSNIKLEDKRGEGVHGMVALTGELTPKGMSTNLRCVFCRLNRDAVNVDAVTWFQENEAAYTTLIAAFAEYVGQHYDNIIRYIKNRFNDERKHLSEVFKERRLVDAAVTLCLAMDIFKMFLQEFCGLNNGEILTMISQMRDSILQCVRISEQISVDESPSEIFVKAIESLMRMGTVKMGEKKTSMIETSIYDGYVDDDFYYFVPESVHKKAVAFLGQTNRYFPYDCKEILTFLADDGISQTASNGAGKRTLCARISIGNGKKEKFLKIRRSVFDAVVDGSFEDLVGV